MTVHQITKYTGKTPALGQEQSELNQNQADQLAYINAMPDDYNQFADEINAIAGNIGFPETLPKVKATSGQVEFFIGLNLKSIQVNRGGTIEQTDAWSYDPVTGIVTISTPATTNEPFQFSYNTMSSGEVVVNESSIQILRPKSPAFVAHRGASNAAPENTIAAFEIAGKNGFWGCECDAQLTADDAWVVIHDDTVDRTTDGSGAVNSKTLAQIKALDAGSWFNSYYSDSKIPTLTEYLQVCQKFNMFPHIEIKPSTVTDAQLQDFIALCIQSIPTRQFSIQSTDPSLLERLRSIDSDIFLKYTVGSYSDSFVDTCESVGKCMLTIVYTAIPSDPAYARSKNVEIAAWTVNDYDGVSDSRNRGAVEIFSNYISE